VSDSTSEGSEAQPQASIPQPRQVALPDTRPIVTYALLVILGAVFLLQLTLHQLQYPADPLLDWGALDFQRVLQGEYYRMFTAMFLHLDQFHIIFNGIALWSIGRSVETFFGHTRFILVYFLGGLAASLLSFSLTQGISVGASGAIFAIFGAEMVLLYRNRKLFGASAQRGLRSLAFLAVLNLGLGLYSQLAPGGIGGAIIDNWAHVGGFIGGIILSWFIGPRLIVQALPAYEPLAATVPYRLKDTVVPDTVWAVSGVFGLSLLAIFVFVLNILARRV